MTFADILADVYRRCGYATSPASEVVTRIKAFVNETQQDIVGEPGMTWLLNDQLTFASVAAQAEYGLPSSVQGIRQVRDTSNRRALMPMSLQTYRQRFPNPATDPGTPEYYVDLGMSPVTAQPSSAQQLTVISTSASDTGTAYLEGYRTGGIFFSTSVTMTGTTLANLGGSDVERVTKFWVSVAAVGEVRLRNAAVDIISRIHIGGTAPHYRMVALVPTPSSAITYTMDYDRTFTDMTINTDEPVLPVQFHRILAAGARAKEYEKQNQLQRMSVARADYLLGLKNLKYYVYVRAAGSPNLRSNAARRSIASAVNVATS
jgi:hypothetical protein